mmetsp:Transcript_5324/g.11264  ORF Transcript_5324/g.11264 Transcript_5324/m.11264 type:complete len:207 (-) Transcript_5324:255-875(-)
MPLAMGCPTTSSSFPLVAYTKDPENCCLVKFHWEGSAFLNSSVISCVVGGCCEAVLAARPGADRDGRPPPSDPRKLPLEEEEGLLLLLLLFLLLLLLPPPPPNCFIRSAMDLRGGGACLGPDSSDDEEEEDPTNDFKEAFEMLDTNGDGTMTLQDLQTVLSALGQQSSTTTATSDLEVMFQNVDKDGDGKIDLNGFLELMQNLMSS